MTKLLTSAAVALALSAGIAFAQTDTQQTQSGPAGTADTTVFASDTERQMYEENRVMLGGFFTDDSISELRTEDEIKATFEAMGADDQASMKTACERAATDRGSYGSVTSTLCAQAGVELN
jgi:hypothetical protein